MTRNDEPRSSRRTQKALVLLLLPVISAVNCFALTTTDHFDLSVDDKGEVQSLSVDDHAAPLVINHALLHLRDVGQPRHAVPLQGNELEATLTNDGNFLQLDGVVSDTTGTDRAVDFDLDASDPTDDSPYPIISANSEKIGLSLAVPPTHPTRFHAGMDNDDPYILLRIGLAKDSANPSHTPFRVIKLGLTNHSVIDALEHTGVETKSGKPHIPLAGETTVIKLERQ